MGVPDKICVAPHQIFDYDLEIQEVGHNGAEEYIRKDALMELLLSLEARYSVFYLQGKVIRDVIDKIDSL